MKNILQLCQEVSSLACTQKPLDLFDEDSQQESLFLNLAKDTLSSLVAYGDWQELIKEGVLKTRARKTDYLVSDFCPDFYSLVNNTIFIKDQTEKVIGSLTPEQYMKEKYFHLDSCRIKFKIQNGCFRFLSQPPADLKIVFQYRSAVVATDETGEEKTELSANTDIPVFDPYLVKLGILWRWYKRNGMDYTEEFNEYEREVKKRFAGSLAVKDIHLSCPLNPEGLTGVIIHANATNK